MRESNFLTLNIHKKISNNLQLPRRDADEKQMFLNFNIIKLDTLLEKILKIVINYCPKTSSNIRLIISSLQKIHSLNIHNLFFSNEIF